MTQLRTHERELPTNIAQNELVIAIVNELEKHDLTDGEYIRVISDVFHTLLSDWAKYQIREERHGNRDSLGGIASESDV